MGQTILLACLQPRRSLVTPIAVPIGPVDVSYLSTGLAGHGRKSPLGASPAAAAAAAFTHTSALFDVVDDAAVVAYPGAILADIANVAVAAGKRPRVVCAGTDVAESGGHSGQGAGHTSLRGHGDHHPQRLSTAKVRNSLGFGVRKTAVGSFLSLMRC